MEDIFSRIYENLIDRVSGPMKFRLVIQPVTATIFAVLSGLKDAKEGKPAYLWALFSDAAHRRDMVRDGWKSVCRVFILAIIVDMVYQFTVFRWIYPFEAFLVAVILAFVPYLLIRGPVNRIVKHF